MKTVERDDTEHGRQYVAVSEAHQAIGQMQDLMGRAVERLTQHAESLASSYRVGGVVRDREIAAQLRADDDLIEELKAAALPWDQRQAQEPTKSCEWAQEDDINMPGTWRSACGVLWTFNEDGPVENGMKFCCGCGKKLDQKKSNDDF